jgi:uncharacterized protein DUF1707
MARRSALRASDSDREQAAERLRSAAADGRLCTEELEHRLGSALAARTYGELDPVVADIPGWRIGRLRDRRAPFLALLALVLTLVVAAIATLAWRR